MVQKIYIKNKMNYSKKRKIQFPIEIINETNKFLKGVKCDICGSETVHEQECLIKTKCKKCLKKCLSCKKNTCIKCTKKCKICKGNVCIECIGKRACLGCELDVCENCFNIYYLYCSFCNDIYCDDCCEICDTCSRPHCQYCEENVSKKELCYPYS